MDDVKMEFTMLGKGYEAWCTGANEAMKSSRKIATVLHNAATDMRYDKVAFVQKYSDPNWTGKNMSMSADGPSLPIILVALGVYPVEAAKIKKAYLTQPQSSAVHPYPNTPSTQAKWGRRRRPKRVRSSFCYYVFEGPWT